MDHFGTSKPVAYCIRVHGHLDPQWSAWFDGMAIAQEPDGTTIVAGLVVDQAALYGLLSKARDLGLTLLGVERQTDTPSASAGGIG